MRLYLQHAESSVRAYLEDCRAGDVVAFRPCEARIKCPLLSIYKSLCILAVDLQMTHCFLRLTFKIYLQAPCAPSTIAIVPAQMSLPWRRLHRALRTRNPKRTAVEASNAGHH